MACIKKYNVAFNIKKVHTVRIKKSLRKAGMNMKTKAAMEKREMEITELLKKEKTVSVKRLAELFNVSEMTIRRDLEILRNNHVIERTYGNASLIQGGDEFTVGDEIYDLRIARIQNIAAKDRIVKYAASLIKPDDLVFLDNGTTVSRITKFLPADFEFSILCYNFEILSELMKKPNVKIIFPGGYYYPEDQTFTSNESVNIIRHLRASIAFVSASGIHKRLGITCINAHSAENKRAIIESAERRIVLADSSKFDVVKANHFANLEDISGIISSTGVPESWISYLKRIYVDLTMV